jgi:formylmethanofuran--tetrahydromethanopterin N-formyltransferase
MVMDVFVEEGELELFPFYYAKLHITALSPEWALTAARTINHANFSTLVDKLVLNQEITELYYFFGPRVGIEKVLDHSNTSDYRSGISLMIGAYDLDALKTELLKRMYAINCPTVSIYDGFFGEENPEEKILVQDLIEVISGSKMIKAKMGELIVLSIPTSEGSACRVQPEFAVVKGLMGASFLICGTAQKETLKATMSAVEAIKDFDDIFCPYPAGINRLGRFFGTTEFYPTLKEKTEGTRVPKGVKCIYEIEIDGISLDSIKRAVRAGIEEACQIKGIKWILMRRSSGKFGGIKVPITEILL